MISSKQGSDTQADASILSGIRVIDFGRYVAGPYCATLLGYLGADVIRVERVTGGEDRYIAPLFSHDDGTDGEGAVFLQTACNKRSLSLNPATPEGREILLKLIATADVFVANLPENALTKMGLDYTALSAIKPDLIYTAISSFGAKGPYANKGGFDGVGQAMSGAMYMTGTPGKPVKAAAPYVDYSTAVMAAFGTMSALYARTQTGEGQKVEASLLGTALAVFNSHLIEQGSLGIDRQPTGNRVQTSAPSDVFETQDGHVLTHVVGPGLFKRVTSLLGKPEWLSDPRFASDQSRGDHRDEICAVMAAWCEARSTEAAIEQLEAKGIPCSPVNTLQQAIDHPQVEAMEFLKQVSVGSVAAPVSDLPLAFSSILSGIQSAPPSLGNANEAVLAELGYSSPDIEGLRVRGILG